MDPSGLADHELLADMQEAQERQAREYARDLEAIARFARHRAPAGRNLSTADGRGGPGLDTRAPADVVLTDVAEDVVPELAPARTCSDAEARWLLREARLLTGPLALTWSRMFAGSWGCGRPRPPSTRSATPPRRCTPPLTPCALRPAP